MNEIPSQQDLDNLFGPLYEEYYTPSTFEMTNNFVANTLDVEDTLSPSSIIVEHSVFSNRFAKLLKENFEMSMMGEMKFFLGLQIHQSPYGIFINQSQYTMELLRKHGMGKCDTVTTPMATAKIDADL
ncbi:retrovirus-related pol polyprotein from transposon TNT 1-94 [Tanacetum coccineum]